MAGHGGAERGSRRARRAAARKGASEAAAQRRRVPRVNPSRLGRVTLAVPISTVARVRPSLITFRPSGPARRRCALDERPGLRPKTIQLYRYLLRTHLQDEFGPRTIGSIIEADVRRWRADLLSAGVSPVTAAKAYRLLKGILATAVEDGLIPRNPCRVKGASVEKSPERPTLTVAQVYALADAVPRRYRALILLACFCGLRWGELAGLRRRDLDTEHRTVHVARQLCEVPGRPPFFAAPKSDAGKRSVAIPSIILPDVFSHLCGLTSPGADTLLFTSPAGKPLRHTNFRRRVWLPALAASGLDVHFHDLRHTGNQLVAEAGANLRELMDRMGHSTSRAALIYLHSTSDRQHVLADAVAARVQAELGQAEDGAR